jgi:hypothetical protein
VALLFSDAFTEASTITLQTHVPSPTGTAWAKAEDTSGVSDCNVSGAGDVAFMGSTNFGGHISYTCTPAPTLADVDVEIKQSNSGPGSDQRPWFVMARYQDTSNYYAAMGYDASAATDKKILKKVAGTYTLIASGDFGEAASDLFKFELRGSVLKWYQNGTERLSVTDSAITVAGKAGLGFGGLDVGGDAAVADWELDDFKVTEYAAAGTPTPGMDPVLLAKLKEDSAGVLFTLTLGAPWSKQYCFQGDYSSETLGHFQGKITSSGPISASASDINGALVSQQLEVTINDSDRELAMIIEGGNGNTLRGASAIIKIGHPEVVTTKWFTRFFGKVDHWAAAGRLKIALTLRNDDQPLLYQPLPRIAITAGDFPNCPQANLNLWAPIVYGKHTSVGFGDKGAITLICVDTVNNRWLVSVNGIKAVDKVYKNGVDAGATWSLELLNFSGILWSLVHFTSSPPAATDTVTADVRGYESTGLGTGTIIDNPALIWRHFMENFVYNSAFNGWYPGSPGVPNVPPLDNTIIQRCADFFTAQGITGAVRIGGTAEQVQARDVVDDFAKAWQVITIFTATGNVAIDVEDHRVGNTGTPDEVYPVEPNIIIADADALGEPSIDYETTKLASRVTAKSGFLEADGGSRKSLEARDPSITDDISETIDNQWVCDPGQAQIANRLVASRRLFLTRRPRAVITVPGPVWWAGMELLTLCAYSDFAMPTSGASVPTRTKWEHGLYRLMAVDVDPMSGTTMRTLRDVRPQIVALREFNLLRKTPDVDENSNARLDMGTAVTRTVTRSTVKQVLDPSGFNRYIQIATNTKAFDYRGLVIEGAQTAQLLGNMFTAWTGAVPDGWTVGSYAGGSSLAKSTTVLYFVNATTGSAQFIAGSPHTVNNVVHQLSGTTFGANAKVFVLAAHHALAANGGLVWQLQRDLDSWYWNHAGQTWASGATNNPLLNSAFPVLETFGPIGVGGTGTKLRLYIFQPSGGTASRQNFLYYADIIESVWAPTPIMTTTATVTSGADTYTISNNSAARCWPNMRVTAGFRVVPLWSSANLTTGLHTVFAVVHDANNHEWVYYDGSVGAWKAEVKAGGTLTTATLTAAVVAGQTYDVVYRRVSTVGELGLAAHTFILQVNGVQTSAVANAAPTEAATCNLEIGVKTSASRWDGFISYNETKPLVLTDAEAQRYP